MISRLRRPGLSVVAAIALVVLLLVCAAGQRVAVPVSGQIQNGNGQRPSAEADSAFEASQTQKFLGVAVRDFPPPQGLTGFDELPANAPLFKFTAKAQPLSGAKPPPFYETRTKVQARTPEGALYEAYVGGDDPNEIVSGHGHVSHAGNTRQRYDTHHGYSFSPQDVFIGQRVAGRLKPVLFFRDVGSHTTAPHHLAIDGLGQFYLAVADVNISQGNRLDLYWVIGNPQSGKWTAAWLIDRRGFTSWAHPWSAARGDKAHLIWNWCDTTNSKVAKGSGAFHVELGRGGLGRKVRVVTGEVIGWDAGLDPRTGRLLIAFSRDDGIYVRSRPEGGSWTRAARLHSQGSQYNSVAIEANGDGAFIIRTSAEDNREWLLRPQ